MPSVFLGLVRQAASIIASTAEDRARFEVLNYEIPLLQSSLLSDRAERNRLQSIPPDPQQQAWCADFTEGLTGEVATVEVPAEGVVGEFATWRRVQIRPGYAGRANYLPARDGQMFHREGQPGYQAYLNAAILPGVQRWRPQYRVGTITAIDYSANTCTLTLQGEDSSAQALVIDPPDLQYTKTSVPIEYMDCNGAVFETGDRVLVEFQGRDWNSPKVIGFEKEPRGCLPNYIVLKATDFWPSVKVAPNATFWNGPANEVEREDHPFRFAIVEGSWLTQPADGLEYMDVSVPEDYDLSNPPNEPFMGLRHDFHSWSIFWNRPANHYRGASVVAAEFYDDKVGGTRLVREIFPDDWPSNEIRVIAPQIDPAGFYRDQDYSFEAKQIGYQIFGALSPSRTDSSYTGPKLNRVAELIGYDKIVHLDVDFTSKWRCSGEITETTYKDPTPCSPAQQLRPVGKFHMEIAVDGVSAPRGPEFLVDISHDPIPETFTISGKTYTRHRVGWISRPSVPLNIDDRWRIPAFVYVLEGAPAPTYAAGFWAE